MNWNHISIYRIDELDSSQVSGCVMVNFLILLVDANIMWYFLDARSHTVYRWQWEIIVVLVVSAAGNPSSRLCRFFVVTTVIRWMCRCAKTSLGDSTYALRQINIEHETIRITPINDAHWAWSYVIDVFALMRLYSHTHDYRTQSRICVCVSSNWNLHQNPMQYPHLLNKWTLAVWINRKTWDDCMYCAISNIVYLGVSLCI